MYLLALPSAVGRVKGKPGAAVLQDEITRLRRQLVDQRTLLSTREMEIALLMEEHRAVLGLANCEHRCAGQLRQECYEKMMKAYRAVEAFGVE